MVDYTEFMKSLEKYHDPVGREIDIGESETLFIKEATWKRIIDILSTIKTVIDSSDIVVETLPMILPCPDDSLDICWEDPKFHLTANLIADEQYACVYGDSHFHEYSEIEMTDILDYVLANLVGDWIVSRYNC